jgi:hypothetical protein
MDNNYIKEFKKKLQIEIQESLPATILIELIEIYMNNINQMVVNNPENIEIREEAKIAVDTLTSVINIYKKESKKMVKEMVKQQVSGLESYKEWLDTA